MNLKNLNKTVKTDALKANKKNKKHKIVGFMLFIMVGLCCADAAAKGKIMQGTFIIFQAGHEIGSESYHTFMENHKIIWSSDTTILSPQGDKSEFHGRLTLSAKNKRPLKYQLTCNQPALSTARNSTLAINFENNQAISDQRTVELHSAHTIVLDLFFVSHYQSLLEHFDFRKNKQKSFSIFMPQTMMEIPASMEHKGSVIFHKGNEQVRTVKLAVIVGAGLVELYVKEDGQLIYAHLPAQRFDVYAQQYTNIEKAETNKSTNIFKKENIEEIIFKNKNITLSGAVTRPPGASGSWPAALMISGSGQQDRDGNAAGKTIDLNYAQIAAIVNEAGFLCLRYDDRGLGASKGYDDAVSFTDETADALAALNYLRAREDVDKSRIILIGHSSGALIASELAAQDKNIGGIVLMARPARPMQTVLIEQLETLNKINNATREQSEVALAQQKAFFEFIASYQEGDPVPQPYEPIRKTIPWFKELLSYDPLVSLKQVQCPVLVLQGANDIQVGAGHAGLIQKTLAMAGNKETVCKVFPGLDHLFMQSEEGNIARYFDKTRTIDKAMLQQFKEWMVRFSGNNAPVSIR